MTINLPDIWDAKSEPKPPDDVENIFDNYITQVREELEKLIAEKQPDKKPGTAASLVAELQLVLQDVGTQVAQAHKGTSREHLRIADQLRNFARNLRSWCSVIVTASGDAAANTRARFSDYGAWATHYSMVRMTITTFFVGISWGIVSLKWNDYADELRSAAKVVWGLAGIFLLIFTGLLSYSLYRQKKCKSLLPSLESTSGRNTGFLRRFFGGFIGTWSPVVFYACLTWGFWVLLDHWAQNRNKTPITWTAIVSNSALDKDKRIATATSVDFTPWVQKFDKLAGALERIKEGLTEVDKDVKKLTPTITSTPTATPGRESDRRQHRKSRRARPRSTTQ
jgi:hypothetical protein